MKATAYVLAMLVLVALSVPGYAQAPDDKLIVPGQRIGNWTLDMTIDDLVRTYGAENVNGSLDQKTPVMAAGRLNSDFVSNVYSHAWHNRQFFVGTVGWNGQRLLFIATFGEGYKTAKGLSFDTPPNAVEALHGKPTANKQFGGTNGSRMIYDDSGLAVRIYGNAVQVLLVFRPGTAKQIWNFQVASTPGPARPVVAQIFGDLLTR